MQNETQNSEEKILKLWSVSFYSSYNALWRFKKKKKKIGLHGSVCQFSFFLQKQIKDRYGQEFYLLEAKKL